MGRGGELKKKFKIKVQLAAREDDRMTRREEMEQGEKRSLKRAGWPFLFLSPGTEKPVRERKRERKGEAEGMRTKGVAMATPEWGAISKRDGEL